MSTHDLVVRAGTVVDGDGGPPRTADVAIDGDRVVEVGRVSGTGRQEISADGALVTPGFVDIHTHYDGQATWESRLRPSSWHGVTTVVMGNCGVGFAPVHARDRDRLVELMEGVEDIPGVALQEGLTWEWSSFAEYLDVLACRSYDIDLAAQLPHAALRVHTMGERAAAREAATAEEIAVMARLAKEAVQAGAIGFSTSRTLNHKSIDGELTPSYDAGSDELVAIAAAIGETGRGVLQLVTDFDDPKADVALMRAMAAASGRPLSVSAIHMPVAPERIFEVLDLMQEAVDDGLTLRGQVGPRPIGMLLGLENTLNPFMTNPVWRTVAGLPVAEQRARMADPDFRARVLAAQTGEKVDGRIGGRMITRYEIMYELSDPPVYELPASASIAARAAAAGLTGDELAYDVIARGAMLYLTAANRDFDALHELLVHPLTVPGLSDGGAHVGTICDGSFPTSLLQHWVRDRAGARLDLAYAVRQQSRDTARAVGLTDRGVLAPGMRADLNVIDLDRLTLHLPEVRHDLPAGGRRLVQQAEGYRHTVVAGQETYRDGEATDALPGRLIRG
jgi:N-acyl-D-aspartate/D-glutamate deacylase